MKPLPKGKVTLEEFKVLQNFLPFFIWSLLVGDTISAEFCKTFLKFAFKKTEFVAMQQFAKLEDVEKCCKNQIKVWLQNRFRYSR